MEFDLLEKLGKIAGIAGITVGALVLIFGGIIKKNIFPKMDQKQGFRLIRTMIVAASIMAILGLAAWIYVETQKNTLEKHQELVVKNILGTVYDHQNNPLSNVQITVDEAEQLETFTDVDGNFVLKLHGKDREHFNLVLKHKKYAKTRKNIAVNFSEDNEDFAIDKISLTRLKVTEEEEGDFVDMSENSQSTSRKVNPNGQQNNSAIPIQNVTDITLVYVGDDYGCLLDITINVGGKTIKPTGNKVYLSNVPLGIKNYNISGVIDCGTYGYCTATGQDHIEIIRGGTYYVMWLNENLDQFCDIGLLTQAEYNLANGF